MIAEAILPIIRGTPFFEKRHEIAWYVASCEMAGFCNTLDMRRACAKRYMLGKRKVSPPGTKRAKRQAAERKKIIREMPEALASAIESAATSEAARQFAAGNDKAINSLVGLVLKLHKSDPSIVRELLVKRLRLTK
jgi:hypothetical protein